MLAVGNETMLHAAEPGTTPPRTNTPKDLRDDPDYLEPRIRSISDEELFGSLDLARPALAGVRAAVERGDYAAAYAAWAAYWPAVAARGHFRAPEFVVMSRQEAAEQLAEERGKILKAAARVLNHDIQGWGDVTIQHGLVVDFNADYGQAGKAGFHYWGWARPVVQAFLLTRDQKYLAEFDRLFNQWYEQRHQVQGRVGGVDIIYYELGLGLRNRVFLEYYCLPFAARPPATHERLLKTVLGAARWLYQLQLHKGYRTGNWQIMGAYGLADIALTLPEFKEAPLWAQQGVERIREHAEQDFFADGCHSERCPASYMMIAYRDPRNLAQLLEGREDYAGLSARLRAPLERTLNWYLYTLPPDGIIPGINDGSRARLAPSVLLDGARLYGRQDMRWAARHILGNAGTKADAADGGTMPQQRSVHFAPSGFTAMRSDWTPQARYLLVNHGPMGGHSHRDALSFELHAYGRPLLIDAGLGRTYDDPLHKTWYQTARAHNMLVVADSDPNRRVAQGQQVLWSTGERLDYLAATHQGYQETHGVTHRRHFVFMRPNYFLIYDVVVSAPTAGEHSLTSYLHATVPLNRMGAGFASPSGPGLVALPSSPDWKPATGRGMASVRGIPGFAQDNAEINWVSFNGKTQRTAPATLGVLLYPFREQRPQLRFERVDTPATNAHFVVEHPIGTDHILINNSQSEMQSMGIRFKGACALVRYTDKRPREWAVSEATRLAVDGKTLVDATTARDGEGTI